MSVVVTRTATILRQLFVTLVSLLRETDLYDQIPAIIDSDWEFFMIGVFGYTRNLDGVSAILNGQDSLASPKATFF